MGRGTSNPTSLLYGARPGARRSRDRMLSGDDLSDEEIGVLAGEHREDLEGMHCMSVPGLHRLFTTRAPQDDGVYMELSVGVTFGYPVQYAAVFDTFNADGTVLKMQPRNCSAPGSLNAALNSINTRLQVLGVPTEITRHDIAVRAKIVAQRWSKPQTPAG